MKMKMIFYISIGLIILCIGVLIYAHRVFSAQDWKDTDVAAITIGAMEIRAEVAATAMKKNQGLSGRESLAEGAGMLFIFSKPHRYPFWMKGMRIPLDFIWIRDGIVVDVSKNIQHPTNNEFPKTIMPSVPADMVLEVQTGVIDVYNVKIGNKVNIKKVK